MGKYKLLKRISLCLVAILLSSLVQCAFAFGGKKGIRTVVYTSGMDRVRVARLKKKFKAAQIKRAGNNWMMALRYDFNDADSFSKKIRERLSALTREKPYSEVIFDGVTVDYENKGFVLSFEVKVYYCKKDKTFYYVFPDVVYDMIFKHNVIPESYGNMKAVEFTDLPLGVVKTKELRGVVINNNSDFEFFVGGVFYKKFKNEDYNKLFFKGAI